MDHSGEIHCSARSIVASYGCNILLSEASDPDEYLLSRIRPEGGKVSS